MSMELARRKILAAMREPVTDGGRRTIPMETDDRGRVDVDRGSEPRRTEANDPLDFEGLIYRVIYEVERDMGARLENTATRASAEAGIEQEIRFSGPLDGHPRVALGPAGRLVGVKVEIGNRDLPSGEGPGSKGALDAALDQAVQQEIGGQRGFPDEPEWSVRCR